MRKFLFFLALLWPLAAAAQGPAGVFKVPTIAILKTLGSSAAAYGTVQTLGYSTTGLGGGFYTWNSSSTTTDCTHVAVTGISTGRFILRTDLQGGQIFPTQCGAVFNDATDDHAAWNSAETAAQTYGLIIGCVPGESLVTTTITPGIGVLHQGCSQGAENNPSSQPEILDCRSAALCFKLQLPNGTSSVKAPDFYDLYMIAGTTGAIQLNTIAGGFTNDSSTQEYMMRPRLWRDTFDMTVNTSAFGFQCSKCFDGDVEDNLFSSGGNELDFEGTDLSRVANNRFTAWTTNAIYLESHSTFGTQSEIDHNDILGPVSATNFIYSNDYYPIITNNFFEGGGSVTSEIYIDSAAFGAKIDGNRVCGSGATNWLVVNDTSQALYNFSATNNICNGSSGGAPVWNGGILAFPGGTIRSSVVHYGNTKDSGFPFNEDSDPNFPSEVVAVYGPAYPYGLTGANYAPSVVIKPGPTTGYFDIPAASSTTSELTFDSNATTGVPLIGTYNVCALAQTTGSASQTASIYFLDASTPIASGTVTMNTTNPTWTCFNGSGSGYAASTNFIVNFANNDTSHGNHDVFLYKIVVSQH